MTTPPGPRWLTVGQAQARIGDADPAGLAAAITAAIDAASSATTAAAPIRWPATGERITITYMTTADHPDPAAAQRIRTTHPHGYRTGQWAVLAAIVPARGRQCYLVSFPDGETDLWPVTGQSDCYEFDPPMASPG